MKDHTYDLSNEQKEIIKSLLNNGNPMGFKFQHEWLEELADKRRKDLSNKIKRDENYIEYYIWDSMRKIYDKRAGGSVVIKLSRNSPEWKIKQLSIAQYSVEKDLKKRGYTDDDLDKFFKDKKYRYFKDLSKKWRKL